MALTPAMRRTVVPYAILGTTLLLTGVVAHFSSRGAEGRERLRFEMATERVTAAIESRLDAYVAMLLGGAGLFAATQQVNLPEFQAYVERLELGRRYPGIQGIGFSRTVHPAERDAVAAEVRSHLPSFRYWPERPPDQTVSAIVYLEPQDERNRFAIGYDMFSEPTRRAAMIRARDTAAPAATRRVVLVQEVVSPEKQAGFLIYVPVYRGGDIPATLEERRDRLLGFVYGPFRADDLLRGILGPAEALEVSFDVFDGRPEERRLLHSGGSPSVPPLFERARAIDVAGQDWTLLLRSEPNGVAGSGRTVVRLVIAGGILLSLLLFAVTMTLVRARDAAERTSEELRRSEEALREAHRAKDEFLAVISHELRTPLNAIVGWAAMLRRGQVPRDAQTHAIEVIERNARVQTRLVEDLLDLSRAVAGHLRLDPKSVDVASALNAAADAVRPDAGVQGVAIEWNVPPTLGTIQADSERLRQIVVNLLANAIKFTPQGGRVTVDAARRDGAVVIRIADTGIGIAPEFLPFVFDRFRQADTSPTRPYSGVGLGLAIVRHLVELHGGIISVASDGPDRGSTFIVRLPESNAANRDPVERSADNSPASA